MTIFLVKIYLITIGLHFLSSALSSSISDNIVFIDEKYSDVRGELVNTPSVFSDFMSVVPINACLASFANGIVPYFLQISINSVMLGFPSILILPLIFFSVERYTFGFSAII